MLYYTLDPSRINCIIYVTSLDAVNCINELSLIHYDCMIYYLLDHGFEINNPTIEIKNYLKKWWQYSCHS